MGKSATIATKQNRASRANTAKSLKKETKIPETGTGDKAAAEPSETAGVIPLKRQQQLLDVFKNSFAQIFEADTLSSLLQEVKQALYERDFERAFGKSEYLEAYAVRWSPTRALGYAEMLVELSGDLETNDSRRSCPEAKDDTINRDDIAANEATRVVCLGGGAAEVVAFGGLLSFTENQEHLRPSIDKRSSALTDIDGVISISSVSTSKSKKPRFDLHLVDSADWSSIGSCLQKTLSSTPPLSKYASKTVKDSSTPLTSEDDLSYTFHKANIFNLTDSELKDLLSNQQSSVIVTLLFTLNELYTASVAKTTSFLMRLTAAAKSNTMLLVMDSPGSYSEASLGKESQKKRYPMQWLMDHTLRGENDDEKLRTTQIKAAPVGQQWERVMSEDSRWFRIPNGLNYPLALENMRYQVHLYRRL